jgi:hypothetical protein
LIGSNVGKVMRVAIAGRLFPGLAAHLLAQADKR